MSIFDEAFNHGNNIIADFTQWKQHHPGQQSLVAALPENVNILIQIAAYKERLAGRDASRYARPSSISREVRDVFRASARRRGAPVSARKDW